MVNGILYKNTRERYSRLTIEELEDRVDVNRDCSIGRMYHVTNIPSSQKIRAAQSLIAEKTSSEE